MTNVLWELPRIEVFGRGKYRTVDYDLLVSGVELSAEATEQVRAFADGYHTAYYREMRRAKWWVGKIGGQIQVLRCHSQDCSARLLLHITDPRNHDPEYHAKVLESCRKADQSLDPASNLSEMRNYVDSWTQARQDAAAAYPEFVDDPLSGVPRLPTPPPVPENAASALEHRNVCPLCLRYWSPKTYAHCGEKWIEGTVRAHTCVLPYTKCIYDRNDLKVFCVGPKAPRKQREYSARVAKTMMCSGEIPADKAGWYARPSRHDDAEFPPHAFVPVRGGCTAGIVIVRHRATRRHGGAKRCSRGWCIDRAWVYDPHRRKGVARCTAGAIAEYFGTEPRELGWLGPFTPEGKGLARAVSGGRFYKGA